MSPRLTLRAATARTPDLRGLGMQTVTVLRTDALCAVGPATPTTHVSSLARLFTASWIRTRHDGRGGRHVTHVAFVDVGLERDSRWREYSVPELRTDRVH